MKFFWYKDEIVSLYVKAKFRNPSLTDHSLGSQQHKWLHAINLCFSKRPWGLLHDITDHVPHHFNIVTKTKYQPQSEQVDWSELCTQAAVKIASSTDRPIAVMWSGGIDSTSALVAFMMSVPLARLSVVCTPESINEFPSFYHDQIQGKIKILTPQQWSDHYKEFFMVTGDGGDTVWGALDESFYTKYQDKLHRPWQDCIDRNIVANIDFVEEFCSWSGIEIKSILDLRVWFYLCCKWQDKCAKVFWLHQSLTDQDAVAFYDVIPGFKNWTMNNLDQIIGDSWQQYKVPAKQFIHRYHRDQNYLDYKTKWDSLYLNIRLKSANIWDRWMRLALPENYASIQLSTWPIIDYQEFENINRKWQLIPDIVLANQL